MEKSIRWMLVFSLLLICLLAACEAGDNDPVDGDAADGDAPADGDATDGDVLADGDTSDGDLEDDGIPGLDELPSGWSAIRPGGETICSRGTEYAYFFHKGSVNKIVIDFVGGGACWNADTCSLAAAIFSESVNVDWTMDAIESGQISGVLDHESELNPFKDWHHVVIPYCTGDIHWGNSVTTYGEGETEVTIQHKGAVNAGTVLDWVYDNFAQPDKIFVTGCSAGAYGSIGWSPHIMKHYPDVTVYQMADSGAGVITENFFRDSFPSWNVDPMLPAFIDGMDPDKVDILDMDLAYFYTQIANYFDDRIFSQYNTAYDDNQTFYFQAMGGSTAFDWSEKMYASIADIEANTDNFVSYIAPGEVHCIIWSDAMYDVMSNNVKLIDWMNNMKDGEAMESVACVDCQPPAVTDGDVTDGDVIDGDMLDGDAIDGDASDGDSADGDTEA